MLCLDMLIISSQVRVWSIFFLLIILALIFVDPFNNKERKRHKFVKIDDIEPSNPIIPNGKDQAPNQIDHIVNLSDKQKIHHEDKSQKQKNSQRFDFKSNHF